MNTENKQVPMSRFNVLYHGEALDAADALGDFANEDELRLALINALSRIARLEDLIRGRQP